MSLCQATAQQPPYLSMITHALPIAPCQHVSTNCDLPVGLPACLPAYLALQAYDCVGEDAVQEAVHVVIRMLQGCKPQVVTRMVAAGCNIAIIGRDQVRHAHQRPGAHRCWAQVQEHARALVLQLRIGADMRTPAARHIRDSSKLNPVELLRLCCVSVAAGHHRHTPTPLYEVSQQM